MGKGGDKSGTDTAKKLECLVEGRMYDVTNFAKRHPGGSVIKFFDGSDSTQAFVEFHTRSEKARKVLKGLPSREPEKERMDVAESAVVKDFNLLRAQLEKEGFFEPAPMHVAYRLAELAIMHLVGIYLLFSGWILPGLMLLGLSEGRCGWLMHEGGHYSLTGNISFDRHIQMLCYGVGCGMSGAWWRNQHNKHHATPQKEGYDVDLNTMPLVCFHKLCAFHKKTKKLLSNKMWIRYQAYLFAPVTCLLVALGWQLYLHPRHCIRRKMWLELGYMGARYAIVAAVANQLGASFIGGLAGYLFYNWCGASYIFCNFAVSHTHLPVVPENEHVDWVVYAAVHTMNCENTAWCNWWMSYLNFQIEHHLFPSMPQFRHPIVSPRVKALFEKHGLKYDQRPYFSAMKDTFNNLDQIGYDVFFG